MKRKWPTTCMAFTPSLTTISFQRGSRPNHQEQNKPRLRISGVTPSRAEDATTRLVARTGLADPTMRYHIGTIRSGNAFFLFQDIISFFLYPRPEAEHLWNYGQSRGF